ncbi:MAG TPA: glycogen/starch/alpha-glucan phosphorylase, partial [Vampirovibrionales bacterium]
VTCSLQDIIRLHLINNSSLDNLHEKAVMQLNDTHPSIAVAELMRLLIDVHNMEWSKAWEITQQSLAYTNHTLLPEALEKWPVSIFQKLLPRHLEIIYEINHRFMEIVKVKHPNNLQKQSELSLIEEGTEKQIRMAHLACVGSKKINGVAKLHTELLKEKVLNNFYELWPEKFVNKTNGVTPRRWLLQSNPGLAELVTKKIGNNWITNLEDFAKLETYVDDKSFIEQWKQIKFENKKELAEYIKQSNNLEVNPNSLFDIQVKRIHEYKRQLLNVLYIITLYNRIKTKKELPKVPRTFIFGGKAAPGYFNAKMVIKLVNAVAEVVNNDPEVKDTIKVVYLPNFRVSLGEFVYPAADLSEQISTAGKEASGTGNMKFAMNGALTIGTLDGANIEIKECVGAENIFIFGLNSEEVFKLKADGYNPNSYYESNPELKQVIQSILNGVFSPEDPDLFKPLMDSLLFDDQYLLFADYQSYLDCQAKVEKAYLDQEQWAKMSILNSARVSYFSSDRTIEEYCKEIWEIEPVEISLERNNVDVSKIQEEMASG